MRILQRAALVACSFVSLHAADDQLQRFHASYRGLNGISFSFSDRGGISGSIIAKRGGSYRITMGDRTIVSDGKTVWNAAASNKTVVINDYRSHSTDVSIERVFFDVMSVYHSSIAKQLSNGFIVRLEAPSAQTQIANISTVEITCSKSLAVTNVRVISHGNATDYVVSKFRANPPTKSSTYSYRIPKGWQSVDIR